MPKKLRDRFAQTLSAYTGAAITGVQLKLFADPKVSGCYAVRYTPAQGDPVDFLFTHGQYDDPDQVEEVELEQWPPVSGAPKFFI